MIDSALQRSAFDLRFARLEALHEAVDDLLRQRPRIITPDLFGRIRPCVREYIDRGLQSVPIYKLVNNNGRYTDFDRWLPLQDVGPSSRPPVDEPQRRSPFNPVALYKVGGVYLVKDGNYRVASARTRGQLFLPAHVTEVVMDTSIDSLSDARDILLTEEHLHFLEVTGIAQLRPTQHVVCATLGNYAQIISHIDDHCVDLRKEWERPITSNVASASWYDTIYMPIVNLVRRQRILEYFPNYHESDIYVWAVEHRNVGGEQAPPSATPAPPLRRFRERLKDALSDVIALARTYESHTLQTVVRA